MYFNVRINPLIEGSSDAIVVDNFHPSWREGARKLLEGRIVSIMEEYAGKVEQLSGVPLVLEFSDEGLCSILTPQRGGLHLENERYRSHNLSSFLEVAAVHFVISEYLHWLKFVTS